MLSVDDCEYELEGSDELETVKWSIQNFNDYKDDCK